MQSVYKLVANTSDFDAKIRKSKANLTQFASHGKLGIEGMTKAIGSSIAAYASWTMAIAGAAKVVGNLVRTNMQFEQSNANLASVLGTTRENVSDLTAQAKQLGATTQYTASQITELQTNLARLGFTNQEILNSTKSVSSFATATVADLGEAANLAGAALRGFGLKSTEMERVCAAMAVATTKSALSFEKLATAIPIVSPVAKQFGFTIEDTLTLLGKLSDAGMDASMAATATRNILLNLANSSGKLAVKLGEPIRSIEDLAPALQKLNDEGINLAEMLRLTDKRSVAAFGTFIQNAGTMKDFKESITDVSGALQAMVDEQLNTLQGSVTIMKSAWEGLMLSFENSNGIIRGVVDELTDLIQTWTRWRNIRNGGDSAISATEFAVNDATRNQWAAGYVSLRDKQNLSDEQMLPYIAKGTEKAQKEYDDLKSILYYYFSDNKHGVTADDIRKINERVRVSQYTVDGGYERLLADISSKKINVDMYAYWKELATPPTEVLKEGEDEIEDHAEKLKTQILRIKNEESKQLAEIEKQNIQDAEERENKIYEIKRNSLLRQRALYTDSTSDDYLRMDTAISNLDAQHLSRLNSIANKPAKVQEEKLEYAPGTYGALVQELQEARDCLNECVVGSEAWAEQLKVIEELSKQVNTAQEEIKVSSGKGADNAKATTDAWQNAAIALQAAASAMNAIDDPSAKIAGTLAQAVASIMLGFAQASASPATGAAGVFGWIAATLSGLATAISVVSTIKSVTNGYAEGGMVLPNGSPYGGDNIVARLNAGEGVLTAKGIETAEQLRGKAQIAVAGGTLSTRIKGGDILIALDNTNRSRGGSRGTYAYSK